MKRFLLIVAFTCEMECSRSFADTLITGTFGSSITPAVTSGYAFILNQDVLVTAIGIYDSGDNGLVGPNKVGIWTGDGSLLVSKLFDSTMSPTLTNHFRWLPLDRPLALSANTAFWVGTFGSEPGLQGIISSGSLSPDVTFIAEVGSSIGSFSFPNSVTNRSSGLAYIGPNLQFSVFPKLLLTKSTATQIAFSWSTNATGFILESVSSLPALVWNTVSNTPAIISNQFSVTLETTNSQGLFRLEHQ